MVQTRKNAARRVAERGVRTPKMYFNHETARFYDLTGADVTDEALAAIVRRTPTRKVPEPALHPTHDPVNHPAHYTQGSVECIDAIESALALTGFIAFLRGQVLKYAWRVGAKGDPLEDAKKGAWYQARLVHALAKVDALSDVAEREDRP